MTFKELNITEPILKAIKEKGYTVPTPIQEKAIPAALAKRDILGCAQTGTGKTASFAIPIIQHLQVVSKESVKRQGIKALILTPTRELALQISECIDDYSKYTRVRHGVIFGGVNQRPQVDMLRKGIDILVATPGRLLDLMNQGHIHLDTIQYFVLDEADRMLDMGFIHDIKRILPKLPKEKQTLFFSATMPDTIVTLTKSLLKNPVKIYITPKSSTVDSINQVVYFVWIFFHIIEFVTVQQMNHQLVPFCDNRPHELKAAKAVMIRFISGEFGVYGIIDPAGGICNLTHHALSLHALRYRQTKVIQYGRSQIDVGGRIIYGFSLCFSLNNKRNIGNFLVSRRIFHLQAVGPQHGAVVRRIDY